MKTRGGSRPGAGRKKTLVEKTVQITINKSDAEKIKKQAFLKKISIKKTVNILCKKLI